MQEEKGSGNASGFSDDTNRGHLGQCTKLRWRCQLKLFFHSFGCTSEDVESVRGHIESLCMTSCRRFVGNILLHRGTDACSVMSMKFWIFRNEITSVFHRYLVRINFFYGISFLKRQLKVVGRFKPQMLMNIMAFQGDGVSENTSRQPSTGI